MSGQKKKSKTHGIKYWDDKLWKVFALYVKYRDSNGERTEEGKPIAECITCKKPVSGVNLHAGHWISRRYKAIKYDEQNVHAQCAYCNKWGNGEPQMYEDEIVIMYGEDTVKRLKKGMKSKIYPTAAELEEKFNEYKQKLARVK